MSIGNIQFRVQEELGRLLLVGGTYGDPNMTDFMFGMTLEEAFEYARDFGKESDVLEVYGSVALTYMTKGLTEGFHIALAITLEEEK